MTNIDIKDLARVTGGVFAGGCVIVAPKVTKPAPPKTPWPRPGDPMGFPTL